MLERRSVIACLAATPRSVAARSAAATRDGERPARSASPSSSMSHEDSSARTFWLNCVPSVASRSAISPNRVFAAGSSLAPVRMKPSCVSWRTRRLSASRPRVSRWSHNDWTRANSFGLSEIAEECAASLGENTRSTACSSAVASVDVRFQKTPPTRDSASPARSSASIVLTKVGGSGRVGDRRDLGIVLAHRALERGGEVLGLDPVERGQAVGGVPGVEKGIAQTDSPLAANIMARGWTG